MDAFAFLTPWIDRLAPVLVARKAPAYDRFFLDDHDSVALAPPIHGLVIKPFDCIAGKAWLGVSVAPIGTRFPGVRCAMEIVALALRVEPRVWTLLRGSDGNKLVDEGDPVDEWGTGTEIAFDQNDYLSATVVEAFFTSSASPQLVSEMETAKQRLCALDYAGRIAQYRIPLTISARLVPNWQSDSLAKVLATVYAQVYGVSATADGRVATTPTHFRPARVSLTMGTVTSEWIQQLERGGIAIDRIVQCERSSAGELPKTVELLRATGHPLGVETTLTGDLSIESLFRALQRGDHIESLAFTIQDKCDGALLARVLAACRSSCPLLRRLEIDCPKTIRPNHVRVVEDTMALALRGCELRGRLRKPIQTVATGTVLSAFRCNSPFSVFVVLPDKSLQQVDTCNVELEECEVPQAVGDNACPVLDVVRLRLTTYDESARRLVAFVVACLPHWLKAFALEIRSFAMPDDYFTIPPHRREEMEGGPPLDGDAVASILAAAPQLSKLELSLPRHLPLDDLLVAYETGRCRARSLAIARAPAVSLALLHALADPATRAFHTIEELSLVCPIKTQPLAVFMDAVERVLRTNRRLAYLELKSNRLDAKGRLATVTRVPHMTRLRLALASVVRTRVNTPTRDALGQMFARIVAFAEAPQRCRVAFE